MMTGKMISITLAVVGTTRKREDQMTKTNAEYTQNALSAVAKAMADSDARIALTTAKIAKIWRVINYAQLVMMRATYQRDYLRAATLNNRIYQLCKHGMLLEQTLYADLKEKSQWKM